MNDSYPPTKTKLKLEALVARLVSPFLGFQGLYQGGPEPVIKSSEPELVARRKSSGNFNKSDPFFLSGIDVIP